MTYYSVTLALDFPCDSFTTAVLFTARDMKEIIVFTHHKETPVFKNGNKKKRTKPETESKKKSGTFILWAR